MTVVARQHAARRRRAIAALAEIADVIPVRLIERLAMTEPRPLLTAAVPSRAPSTPNTVAGLIDLYRAEFAIDEDEAARAAMRAHLANPADYGPVVTRVFKFSAAGIVHTWTARGPLSAFHRAIPDMLTVATWEDAGAQRGRGAWIALQVERG